MSKISKELLEKHIKTHTERSNDDRNAVSVLEVFLRSDGKINHNFSRDDKWPNIDGSFELVPNPTVSRRPKQNFVVQIKGTTSARITKDGMIKYQLQSLAFPAYVAKEITLDPSILFLVLNPGMRDCERVFWKYISPQFITSINFENDSATITFTEEDEIKNSEEAVNRFVDALDNIADTHSYLKQLEPREYTLEDVKNMITARCEDISEAIEMGMILNYTRDKISRKILTALDDLCKATLMFNGLRYYNSINLRTAWEMALMNIETKFLATFLQGLRYIGLRVPEEGQYERLMLKYYGFLWKIRKYLTDTYNLSVLENLEKFPLEINDEDVEYNKLLADAIELVADNQNPIKQDRYYIQNKSAFYVGTERYFEITLQLSDKYATKYNRITVYSKKDISSNYSIQVGCAETEIMLWDNPSKIKVITNWRVSIEPAALNKLSKLLRFKTKLSSNFNEYSALMAFLTESGMNLLDFIDLQDAYFNERMEHIFRGVKTKYFKIILIYLHKKFNDTSTEFGKNTIRYTLIKLREELLEELLPEDAEGALSSDYVYLTKKCYPFEKNPILYNLPRNKTNGQTISKDVIRAVGSKKISSYLPYIRVEHLINSTGELYHLKEKVEVEEINQTLTEYNVQLTLRDKQNGQELREEKEFVYLDEYVKNTVFILQQLLNYSSNGNDGQQHVNQKFIESMDRTAIDDKKIVALQTLFVDSKVMVIYGAAGTGKTTLMNYISNLMDNRSKLFLAKTHTAKENLQRRIQTPGFSTKFMVIDKFINSRAPSNYDVIFVDECSTIDNRTMVLLMEKINNNSLLVLAGDIYQIESIDFGNWFFYAKEILPEKSIVELNSTWRTQEQNIKELWEEVRFLNPLITEKLVIDGPFSENIGKNIFTKTDDDEIVLCLNYDGKFGLNSINSYFQDANPSTEAFYWSEWRYKVGDRILFNENKRFPMLYNNLKGVIVDITKDDHSISFTIDVPILLTASDIGGTDLERVFTTDSSTRIRFTVSENDENQTEDDYERARMKSIVPFQLAYAVSIHKAQGLEYNSIKVVIPNSNSEKITHGIFYTAITRTKEKLKIFWSPDTMNRIISSFNNEKSEGISLEFIKRLIEQK